MFIFGSAMLVNKEKMSPYHRIMIVLLIKMVINFIVGHRINAVVIHRAGEKADAQVTGKEETSTQYNNQNVYQYNVLLKTQTGQVVERCFRTDDFNVYPVTQFRALSRQWRAVSCVLSPSFPFRHHHYHY